MFPETRSKVIFCTLAIIVFSYTACASAQPADSSGASIDGTLVSGLTADLAQIAKIIGAYEVLSQVEPLQGELKRMSGANSNVVEILSKRQKLIYLRQKLNSLIETANLEVNSTRGLIESLMAEVQTQQAQMVEKRARTLRKNTIINFVSGGLTKIAGYSIAIANVDMPSNVLEVFDGTVQCGLSGYVLKDLHSEGRIVKPLPLLLRAVEENDNKERIYPQQVWHYLNESNKEGETRRASLSSAWEKRGYFSRRDRASSLKSAGGLSHHVSLARITPQLLDDRLAMLSELRSVVSEMHFSLMELSRRIKQSYKDDPSFDWPV